MIRILNTQLMPSIHMLDANVNEKKNCRSNFTNSTAFHDFLNRKDARSSAYFGRCQNSHSLNSNIFLKCLTRILSLLPHKWITPRRTLLVYVEKSHGSTFNIIVKNLPKRCFFKKRSFYFLYRNVFKIYFWNFFYARIRSFMFIVFL